MSSIEPFPLCCQDMPERSTSLFVMPVCASAGPGSGGRSVGHANEIIGVQDAARRTALTGLLHDAQNPVC
ncbi:hypothetical protein EAM_0456 [Erwinia amylovora ATCC 49946]|nr:hypothetical protein EAM_0456 [Erwinia amylovora ATCC 49946]